jgi:tetratricopeptide (TPR) repeat protein
MKIEKLISEAIVRYKSGQYDQARNICARALKSAPGNLVVLNIFAGVESMQGNPDKAIVLYQRSLAIKPKQAMILKMLGVEQRKKGEIEAAIKSLLISLNLHPSYDANLQLGLTYTDAENFHEAETYFRAALLLNPSCWMSVSQLSGLLAKKGLQDQAAKLLEEYIKIEKTNPHAYAQLAQFYLMNSNPKAALEVNAESLRIEPAYTRGFALKYLALSELGDKTGMKYLYDYEKLVQRISAKCPPSFDGIKSFNSELANHITNNVQLHSNPKAYTTVKGSHSGFDGLFNNNKPLGDCVRNMVQDAVDEYIANLAITALDSDHPIYSSRPSEYRILIWAVVTGRGGHELPHIHPKSWIGGSFYVELPDDFDSQPSSHAGWIEFGRGEEGLHQLTQAETMVFKPVEGDFLIFPGYFWHNTIPLESDGRRIVMAFDVQPIQGWGK